MSGSTRVSTRATTTGRARVAVRSRRPRRSWKAYLYVLPAFVVFAVFLGGPSSKPSSTPSTTGTVCPRPRGRGAELPRPCSPTAPCGAFGHALILMVFYAVIPVVLGLFLTALISRANALRGMSAFRTILFLPQVIASVVVATIWVSIYSQDGLVNGTLGCSDSTGSPGCGWATTRSPSPRSASSARG